MCQELGLPVSVKEEPFSGYQNFWLEFKKIYNKLFFWLTSFIII